MNPPSNELAPPDERAGGEPTGGAGPSDAAEGGATSRGLRFTLLATSTLVLLVAVVAVALGRTDGTFTYAIDDPLIHLTLARNLGGHGTFGIVPGVYESASSAPLWTLLLAPFAAALPDAWWVPLGVELAAAGWLLRTISGLPALARLGSRWPTVLVCLAVPELLGLVPLVLTGMEHVLHAAIVAGFLVLLARLGTPEQRRGDVGWALALLAAGTLVRFETGFLAASAALVLLIDARHDRRSGAAGTPGLPAGRVAAGFLAAAAIPAATFAAVNVAFGQYPLPSSVVAKSDVGGGVPIPDPVDSLGRLVQDPALLAWFALGVVACCVGRVGDGAGRSSRLATRALLTVVLTVILHVCFAEVGWFDRYQAYLVVGLAVGLGIAAPALRGWAGWRTRAVVVVLALGILRIPLLVNTPVAMTNIFQNQYQLGRFLAEAYPGTGIAVNDIGYVSWDHDGPLLDVAGLGSIDALRASKAGELDAERFAELAAAQEVQVLAVYPRFFGHLVPEDWREAGRWCVTDRLYVLSSDCVAFYAPDGEPLAEARAALERYAPSLPAGVVSTVTS